MGPSGAVVGAPRGSPDGTESVRFELHAVDLDQRRTRTPLGTLLWLSWGLPGALRGRLGSSERPPKRHLKLSFRTPRCGVGTRG